MQANTGKKIWMDGRMVDFADAHVHAMSHSLHYGVGVFEGIRAYSTTQGPAIFRLTEHVQRLLESAKCYHLSLPYSRTEIEQAILETQAANGILPSYIRPLVYRGEPTMGVKNLKGKVSLMIAAIPAKKYLGEGSDGGVRAKISPFRKPHSDSLPSYAKASGNYLSSYLAGTDAALEGYEEAVLLDSTGFVAEGTGENVFVVRAGKIFTPGPESDILMGITRDSVIRIASDLGYPVYEGRVSVSQLLSAEEAFFSGTYAEIAPIKQIGAQPIGSRSPGPITQEIMEVFYRTVKGEEPKYLNWLAPVPEPARPMARVRTK